PEVHELTTAPKSMVAWRSFSTTPRPENASGRGTINASIAGSCHTVMAPTTIANPDKPRAGVKPCHKPRLICWRVPMATADAAVTVPPTIKGKLPRTKESEALTAGYPQKLIRASLSLVLVCFPLIVGGTVTAASAVAI